MGAPAGRLRRLLRWLALVGLVLGAAALLAAAAEGFTRLRNWARTGNASGQTSLYRVDPESGLRVLVPNQRFAGIEINSLGFRGPEIELPKPPGRIRIAFLGASTTYCAEVSGNAATWPQGVVDRLNAAFPQARFDYVNAAAPGYTVLTSLRNFERRVKPLEPDIVVVYHATNDLSAELRRRAVAQGLAEAEQPRRGWLESHVLLWDLAVKNWRLIAARQAAAENRGRLDLAGAPLGERFGRELSNLLHSTGHAARRSAVVSFATRLRRDQTPAEQRAAAVSALVYMPYMSLDGLIEGYAAYNGVIRAVAARHGALLVGGEDDIPGDAIHFADSVHFTDAGSARMAERVAAALAADPVVVALARAAAEAAR